MVDLPLLNIQKVVNVDAFVVADVAIGFPVLCNAVIVDKNKLTRNICIYQMLAMQIPTEDRVRGEIVWDLFINLP